MRVVSFISPEHSLPSLSIAFVMYYFRHALYGLIVLVPSTMGLPLVAHY